jgi:WD40 repeat protein
MALWDLGRDRLVFRQKVHEGPVADVKFSPDGGMMASAGSDGIRVRRVARPDDVVLNLPTQPGELDAPKPGEPAFVRPVGFACLAFTPDGSRIVGGSSHDTTLFIWRISDGRLLKTIPYAHGRPGTGSVRDPDVNIIAVTPDGRLIMSIGSTTKRIEETKLKIAPTKNPEMREVRFWDIQTGHRVADYRGDEECGSGDWITHEVGFIVFYEAGTGRTVREIRRKEKPIGWAVLAPDGRMLVVGSAGSRGGTQFLGIESETGQTRWTNPPEDQTAGFYPVVGFRFVSNSPWFLAALRDGNVIRLNGLTGHEQRRFLAYWRTPQQKNAGRPSDPSMHQATFSPDGRTLVSTYNERLYLRDVESGTMRRESRRQDPKGCDLALAPDGRTLATSEDTIRIFDIESGQQVLALEPDAGRANVMAFSPDSKRLYTGSVRSGIIWDVRRGQGAAKANELGPVEGGSDDHLRSIVFVESLIYS